MCLKNTKISEKVLKWLNKSLCILLSILLAIIVLDFTKHYIKPRGWKEKEDLSGIYNINPCFCYLCMKMTTFFDLEKI